MWNERLAMWFGLSRASWLTLPRSMMVQMPDEWQEKMAELLEEWDKEYRVGFDDDTIVQLMKDGKFIKTPEFLLNYRHPASSNFDEIRGKS